MREACRLSVRGAVKLSEFTEVEDEQKRRGPSVRRSPPIKKDQTSRWQTACSLLQ